MSKKLVRYAFLGDMSVGLVCLLVAAYYAFNSDWSMAGWLGLSAVFSFGFAVFKPLSRIPGISRKRAVRV